ncbi:MAG: 4-phosphopantetheinyl transferase [Bacteroidetes bacterium]|nr:4-phosphopantetheinyl transferase [Bacteroidota bacterium]
MNNTTIYVLAAEEVTPLFLDECRSFLPEQTIKKSSRFHFKKDADIYLLGQLLILRMLRDNNYSLNSLYELKLNEYGKPFIDNKFHFNISHSKDLIVGICTVEGSVGIDIEAVEPVNMEDFKDVLTEQEWLGVTQPLTGIENFYKIWTSKEAVMKADGRGLSIPLKEVNIEKSKIILSAKEWNVKEILINNEYKLHIAADFIIKDLQTQFIRAAGLIPFYNAEQRSI